jgi:hypothetical protein
MAFMNPRYWLIVFLACIGSAFVCGPARAAEWAATAALPPVELLEASDGWTDLLPAEGMTMSSLPARPRIPILQQVYALPPDTDLDSVSLTLTDTETVEQILSLPVRPGAPLLTEADANPFYGDAQDIIGGQDQAIYSRDADYPASPISIVSVTKMRKWVLVRVAIPAALYNPVTGLLKQIKQVDFQIGYTLQKESLSKSTLTDSVMDAQALAMIENPQAARDWYPGARQTRALPAGTGYLIMTTDQIYTDSTNLYGLISHKRSLGYDVAVVTETTQNGYSIATGWNEVTGQAPDGKADRMRKWLQTYYLSLGVEYVLLIGNPDPAADELPMKELHYQNYVYPVDCFYSDLSGNWDIDANGLYGNETNDVELAGGVDLDPEVYVGRIPVYHTDTEWRAILRSIILKTIKYELELDIDWRRSGLLPESFSNADTDGAYLGEHTRSNILEATGGNAYTMYQHGTASTNYNSIFACDEELVDKATVRHWMNNSYGMVLWWAHGWSKGATVYGGGYLFESKYCPMLDNDHPATLFMSSCTCGNPAVSDNISYSMLKDGGIASVAAGQVSWFYSCEWDPLEAKGHNASMGYDFMRKVIDDERSFGQALAQVKSEASGWWNNRYTFSLYGDPSLFITSQGTDTDLDGLPDLWETRNGLTVGTADASGNPDGDTFTNLEEYHAGLNPKVNDSPDTGLASLSMVGTFNGWNLTADSLSLVSDYIWAGYVEMSQANGVEFKFAANGTWDTSWGDLNQLVTNDQMSGVAEITNDNILAGDGLDGRYRIHFNELTLAYRIEPAPEPPADDSDSDGMPDAWETTYGLDVLVNDADEDPDHDGASNLAEYLNETDPTVWNGPESLYTAMTIAGSFNSWNETETNMFLVADYTWRCDLSFTDLSGLNFKFTADGSWAQNWGDADQIETGIPMSNVAENGAGNIAVIPTLSGLYRATFNELTGAYSMESTSVLDTDNDGMDDDWETANGFSPRNALDAWDDDDGDGLSNCEEYLHNGLPGVADTDGDGMDDLDEWIAGTELDNSNSIFASIVESTPSVDAKLSWPGMTGRTYTVVYATDMFNATLEPMAGYSNMPCSTPGTMELTLTNLPVGCHYFGIQVKK